MALLVLFPGAARAWIVATDFIAANHLLNRLLIAGSSHACLLQFAPFLALELALDLVERGLHTSISVTIGAISRRREASVALRLFGTLAHPLLLVCIHHLHQVEVANRLFLEAS